MSYEMQPTGPHEKILYKASELRPWMKRYASWIAMHDTLQLPPWKERMKRVQNMVHGRITKEGFKFLEARQDFQNFVEEMRRDERQRARVHMEIVAVDMIDMHRDAAEGLMAEGKFDKIAPLTTPYLDRIWPKKDEEQQQAQVIQINLGGNNAQDQIASLEEANIPLVEAVEIHEEAEEGDNVS